MILVCIVVAGAVEQLALASFAHYLTKLWFARFDQTGAKAKATHTNMQNLWNTCSFPAVRPNDEHLAARSNAGYIVDVRGYIGWLPILAKDLAICE